MRKIMRVEVMDDPNELAIQLDNGNSLLLNIAPKQNEPLFAEIRELALPKTDGSRVYWSNGASMTLDEIIKMVKSNNKTNENRSELNGSR